MSAPNVFEDLSGISTSSFSNPYLALIAACEDDPAQIQKKYAVHRAARNSQQKAKMLDTSFPGVSIDPILLRLHDPTIEPGYVDPRHCLVFWGRPTTHVKDLIHRVQQELLTVAPKVTHSKTTEEIQRLVDQMREKVPPITDYTSKHRVRLIKPTIGYDASALALSFIPAAGEALHSGRTEEDDRFTYHHLRRDLFGLVQDTGVTVDSRYVVPSSHLTIGRFINTKDLADDEGSPDPAKMATFIKKIEEINAWLEKEFWPEHNDGKIPDGGVFNLGEGTGLDYRMGTLWYGGGESVHRGKGFQI
ncbi:hypothetical protein N0V91_001138 [Didymella pomorum]|uniref:Uncharacterized protein n=1 Tax=Didymella pomorum TaxID=749634 RepID=A0A9W8ZN62_9PLEO|nr:hypothetical protein N0V91_001138 [Didymella pomorum]